MLTSATRISSASRPFARRASPRSAVAAGVAALALGAALALPGRAAAESAPTRCDKVAAPSGSDSAAGTAEAPLRTAQALANALAPGQVGCLRAGSYGGGLRIGHGGGAGAPLTLRSYPGEQAQITGRFYIPSGSNYVTIADLRLDGNFQSGQQLPSPSVDANDATFEADDVTNEHTGICFDIGSETWGSADSTVLTGNRIHDCGIMPSTNLDHGIYLQDATNTRITGNLIDHNADRGIQFYPSAQNSVVSGNVIADNGEGIDFSGAYGVASNGNVVEHNLIVNSTIRHDVESWYPSGNPVGVGNVLQSNCLSSRGVSTYDGGFTARANVTVAAAELAGEGGYQARPGTACAGIVAGLSVPRAEGPASSGEPPAAGKEPAGATPLEGAGHTTGPQPIAPRSPSSQPPTHRPAFGRGHGSRFSKRAGSARHRRRHAAHRRTRSRRGGSAAAARRAA
ncbi:MAG TPA: right-handed parallel beta-helix repeat-containing protein [Solirubrobacteraceae bacterium]|jgi:parallel beta-helix repeat protein|nr:right-handed parallel beta-helix repeat-containing protein [Solirubrobacteraceae bacterium]